MMRNNKHLVDDYCAITIALTPILSIYLVAEGISIAFVLQVIAIILCFPKLRKNISGARPEVSYILSVLVISFFGLAINIGKNWFNLTLFWHNLFAVVFTFVFIVCVLPGLDCRKLIQYTLFLGIIVSLLTIYQRIQLFKTGTFTHLYIFPDLFYTVELNLDYLRRPTSLFSEPSHISIYLLPLLYISLYLKKYYLIAFFVLGILFSGSTLGLVGLGLLAVIFVFKGQKTIPSKLLYVTFFIILLSLVFRFAPDVFTDNFEKIESTDSGTSIRLLGAFSVLQSMSVSELVFGIGLNQMESFTRGNFPNYSNSVLYSIISYGFIGLLALLYYCYKRYRQSHSVKGFSLIFIMVLLSDQILFNRNYVYLSAFVILSSSFTQFLDKKENS